MNTEYTLNDMMIDDFIDQRDIEAIENNLHRLPQGFKAQAQAIISGNDLAGGMVAMQDQIYMIMGQIK